MTRVYSCINDIEKCDQLQIDLNSVYDWDHANNMFLMPINLINLITSTFSEHRGRSCVISYVNVWRVGTLAYNNFIWR